MAVAVCHLAAVSAVVIFIASAVLLTVYATNRGTTGGLPKPDSPTALNGFAWPTHNVSKASGHFFGIGDWGGTGWPGNSWTNPGVEHRREILEMDIMAQGNVAREIKRRALISDPDFVVAAGDNFYPGGLEGTCSTADEASRKADRDSTGQFESFHAKMYEGPGLDGKPWLACLGNHDFGGRSFDTAWDVQIFRTWTPYIGYGTVWRMPALYWSQRVQYLDFAVDFNFLESNFFDAEPAGLDLNHNMCGHGSTCYDINPKTCPNFFHEAWAGSVDMLRKNLAESDARWQVVVTHFPGPIIAPMLATMADRIDLLITGHAHFQAMGSSAGIDWIISGGGGGVTSDAVPREDGRDSAYGFVDITVSSHKMIVDLLSWGGHAPGHEIITQSKTLKPKLKANLPSGERDETSHEALEIHSKNSQRGREPVETV